MGVDPKWTKDPEQTSRRPPKPFDVFAKPKKSEESPGRSRTVGVALVGLGLAKLIITRHAPDLVHQFARANVLAAAAIWLRRGGRRRSLLLLPGLPGDAQSVLMGLY